MGHADDGRDGQPTDLSGQRWEAIFARSPIGIAVTDDRSRIVEANGALCALLGRSRDQLLGHMSAEYTVPADRSTRARNLARIDRSADGAIQEERRFVRPDGEVRWAWLSITTIGGPDGIPWTLAHVQDITARKQAQAAAAQSEANLMAVARAAQRIQISGHPRQTIVDAGAELAGASYVSLVEPHASLPSLAITASTNPDLVDTLIDVDGTSATVEAYRSGTSRFIGDPASDPLVSPLLLALTGARSVYIVPVTTATETVGVLVVGWDRPVDGPGDQGAAVITLLATQAGAILRQASLLAELDALTITDPLTGLANRRGWDRRLSDALDTADRAQRALTVAIADVDHFKRYNDAYGHHRGDLLLRAIADVATRVLRRGDTAARWGGEEFAFALPGCAPDEAVPVLHRICSAIPEAQTISIGCAGWDGTESAETLMIRADRALYEAKRSGRARISLAV